MRVVYEWNDVRISTKAEYLRGHERCWSVWGLILTLIFLLEEHIVPSVLIELDKWRVFSHRKSGVFPGPVEATPR